MAKKTCPKCGEELLEDGGCPTCGPLEENTEEAEETEESPETDEEEENLE
jgi:uncharacterized Zn finger protein (UPF0148 family)